LKIADKVGSQGRRSGPTSVGEITRYFNWLHSIRLVSTLIHTPTGPRFWTATRRKKREDYRRCSMAYEL
jgi:hypothetical protein